MSRPQRKVIISGGGTGGHIFPAIAIANALKRRDAGIDILFVGAQGRMEMEKIPKAGYQIVGLPIAGLQRKLDLKNLMLPFKVINSVMKARAIVKQFRPDVAVGVGGYASAPLLFAASWMKVPCLIQEQNSYAGITNKQLGKRVKKICVAYDGMEKFFPSDKIVLTGNPVRHDIIHTESKREEGLKYFGLKGDRKILLVIGGSLGARTINDAIRANLDELSRSGIEVLWQTGNNYFDANSVAANDFHERIKVLAFIDRMDLAYAVADVVISRAGALSIAELCVTGKPGILVPSPNVAEDHQTKNALALVNKNAAIMVKDQEANEKMVREALNLLQDVQMQQQLRNNIAALAKPRADEEIADEIFKLMKN
ncbi:MAG: undecaprenyldiphospho-muramoylpentapeptide beta-N-acetylglucosaminyltransferase [Chitinophagales bacterium]|nr:undecaprenyldiphospho-muramoylpentapeptide beta-N-acetylglucosaminyltransferase [Chitinophagales bacterium]